MKNFITIFIILFLFLIIGNSAQAGCECSGRPSSYSKEVCTSPDKADENCVWKEDKKSGEPESLTNPLKVDTPQELIGQIINALLGIVGSLALLMFIYGGFVWMTAAGSQEKVTLGRNILVWATIGLITIFASYSLVNFIITDAIGAK